MRAQLASALRVLHRLPLAGGTIDSGTSSRAETEAFGVSSTGHLRRQREVTQSTQTQPEGPRLDVVCRSLTD